MDRRAGGVELTAERVVIAVWKMICFGVGVGGGPHILEFTLRNRRFVGRQHMRRGGRFAGREKKNRDERRENSEGEVTKFSVGQGGSPATY